MGSDWSGVLFSEYSEKQVSYEGFTLCYWNIRGNCLKTSTFVWGFDEEIIRKYQALIDMEE